MHEMRHRSFACVIDAIYEAALEPSGYENFTKVWEETVIKHILADEDFQLSDGIGTAALNQHFERALKIFEKTRRSSQRETQAFLSKQSFAAAILHVNGTVISSNSIFRERFGLNKGENLYSHTEKLTRSSNGRQERFLDWLSSPESSVAARFHFEDGSNTLIILEKLEDHEFTDIAEQTVVLAKACQAEWSGKGASLLARSFGLTDAELQVAKLLYEGHKTSEIAEQRGRSLGTVQKQLKAVLSKTQLSSQAEFISLTVGLMHVVDVRPSFQSDDTLRERCDGNFFSTSVHELSRGNRIQFAHYGRRDGKPVLLVHGHTFAAIPPQFVVDAAAEAGLQIIAPCKPGIGESTLSDRFDPMRFMAGCISILSTLQFERVALAGHAMSGVYAINAATKFRSRFSSVTLLDTGPPLVSESQFLSMPESSRRIFLAARSSPELLYAPFAFASESANLSEEAERAFVFTQFAGSEHDVRLLEQPNYYALARRAMLDFMSTPERSVDELIYWVSDWSTALQETCSAMPVHFIHSELHDWLPHSDIARLCRNTPNTTLSILDETAQLFFYEEPRRAFAALYSAA